jgi:hypothetical protein
MASMYLLMMSSALCALAITAAIMNSSVEKNFFMRLVYGLERSLMSRIGKLLCYSKDESFVLKERKVSTNEIFQQMKKRTRLNAESFFLLHAHLIISNLRLILST